MTDSLVKKASAKVTLKDCCEEIAQRIDNPAVGTVFALDDTAFLEQETELGP